MEQGYFRGSGCAVRNITRLDRIRGGMNQRRMARTLFRVAWKRDLRNLVGPKAMLRRGSGHRFWSADVEQGYAIAVAGKLA